MSRGNPISNLRIFIFTLLALLAVSAATSVAEELGLHGMRTAGYGMLLAVGFAGLFVLAANAERTARYECKDPPVPTERFVAVIAGRDRRGRPIRLRDYSEPSEKILRGAIASELDANSKLEVLWAAHALESYVVPRGFDFDWQPQWRVLGDLDGFPSAFNLSPEGYQASSKGEVST